MVRVLDSYWFNNGGIVRVQTEDDGIKYYIKSIGDGKNGSQEEDEQTIAQWGNTFPSDVGDLLFKVV